MIKAWSTKQFLGGYAELAYEGSVQRVPALLPNVLQWSQAEIDLAKSDWARLKPGLSFTDWLGALIAKQGPRKESFYQASLALHVNGKREKSLGCFGRIDVVTSSHCIEVKEISQIKAAIGQALVYAYVTKLKPALGLFGEHKLKYEAINICKHLGLEIWYYKDSKWDKIL
jgi:hypothetical protein